MKRPLRRSSVSIAAALFLCFVLSLRQGTASALPNPDLPATAPSALQKPDTVSIPGPLRSFLRMAGISQKVSPDDVLPLLARNVYLHGYQKNTPTEFLILIDRYIHQARELQILSGTTNTIRVAGCDDAGTLVQILGYRLRPGCGQKNFSLETADPERAFLTIDSGFPLVELEEALQKAHPSATPIPPRRSPCSSMSGLEQDRRSAEGR